MSDVQERFKREVEDGTIKKMTLVEFAIKDEETDEYNIAPHMFSGQKRDVVYAGEEYAILKNAAGVESRLTFEGEWDFKGHALTVKDANTVLKFVVNPLF